MTILNWFSILAIMVIIGLYTWVGYLWGKLDTQKKWLKDLKKINSKLEEINDLRQYEPVNWVALEGDGVVASGDTDDALPLIKNYDKKN